MLHFYDPWSILPNNIGIPGKYFWFFRNCLYISATASFQQGNATIWPLIDRRIWSVHIPAETFLHPRRHANFFLTIDTVDKGIKHNLSAQLI